VTPKYLISCSDIERHVRAGDYDSGPLCGLSIITTTRPGWSQTCNPILVVT
jgi:hypothetical protein